MVKTTNEPKLRGCVFLLKNSKSAFLGFKKFRTKIVSVDNVELYLYAKSQLKSHYILGTHK
jgi:hypothetical protein